MEIAIVGTRGIPNHYSGFEQFAEIFSLDLVKKDYNITVYCSKNHQYKKSDYNGVKLIHKYDPEHKIGTAGMFIYDLLCMLDTRRKKYDIIFLLGYTSSSIWQRLIYKKGAIVITNMDGLEWKRSKYSPKVQKFLKYAEKLAVKYSDYLVADSIGIQNYIKNKYGVDSKYIPYGSYVFDNPTRSYLAKYNLCEYEYNMLIARFEPENNFDMILESYLRSSTSFKLILVGNYKHNKFGRKLYDKYSTNPKIIFLGGIFDQTELNNLRYFSNLYYHGHSVGGTNPSLLEAMGSSCLICYHNNEFNSSIVGNEGFPFNSIEELIKITENASKHDNQDKIDRNLKKIEDTYNWTNVNNQFIEFFKSVLDHKK
jgi:hypothetical protein